MLKSKLIHPDLSVALGRCGHNSRVLITDANYPMWTTRGPNTQVIQLNVMPGLITSTQALEAVLSAIPVEKALVMEPHREGPYAMQGDPPIYNEFRSLLEPTDVEELDYIAHPKFYDEARMPTVGVAIATGEQRLYANVLLTVGVIKPD